MSEDKARCPRVTYISHTMAGEVNVSKVLCLQCKCFLDRPICRPLPCENPALPMSTLHNDSLDSPRFAPGPFQRGHCFGQRLWIADYKRIRSSNGTGSSTPHAGMPDMRARRVAYTHDIQKRFDSPCERWH